MLEAEEVLDIPLSRETKSRARAMVDHALANGWDSKYGGLYDAGYYFPDWHAKHIFIKKDSDEIALIDLERFLPLGKWPWYFSLWIVFYFRKLKVWRKLRRSLESDLFSNKDLKSYFCEQ